MVPEPATVVPHRLTLPSRFRPAAAAIAIAGALYVVAWPRVMVNGDEVLYAGQARALLKEHLKPVAGDPFPLPVEAPASQMKYPPGWPTALAIFAPFGFRAMFLAPLLAYLAGAVAFTRLLDRRGLGSHLVVVYLFSPVIWPLARTLMSDVPVAAALLIAIDAYEDERTGLSAVAVAWILASRVAGIFLVLGLLICTFRELWRRPRVLVAYIVAGLVGLSAVVWQNHIAHGTWLSSPYSGDLTHLTLAPASLIENSALYLGALAVLPPFSLICVLVARRRVDRWIWASIPTLVFFICYQYHDRSSHLLETFVGGQRLVIPVHLVWMVSTARIWGGALSFRFARPLTMAAGTLAGIAGLVAMHGLEARYSPARDAIAGCPHRTVGFNFASSRVALAVDAERYDFIDLNDSRAHSDELIAIALTMPTNQPIDRVPNFVVEPWLSEGPWQCRQVGEFQLFVRPGTCLETTPHCSR